MAVEFSIALHKLSPEEIDVLMDDFIDFVEANHTFCSGGGDHSRWSIIVEVNEEHHNAEELTAKIKAFFENRLGSGFEYSAKVVGLDEEEG